MKGFEDFVRKFGASGLGYFQMKEDGLKGPLNKFFEETPEKLEELVARCEMEVGDIIFFGAGTKKLVLDYMGRLRIELAEQMNLIPEDTYEFLWVVDFPMFETEDGKTKALHHPFTMPKSLDDTSDLEEIESIAYDIVLNGTELGGGSIRIHKSDIQAKIFELMNISEEEQQAARVKLQMLPRNASPVRLRSRCTLTGRPRGVYSKFGLGRSKLREIAMSGQIPGIMKASW